MALGLRHAAAGPSSPAPPDMGLAWQCAAKPAHDLVPQAGLAAVAPRAVNVVALVQAHRRQQPQGSSPADCR